MQKIKTMKRNVYLILGWLCISAFGFAQTLTQSANAPVPGESHTVKGADTTNALPNTITGSGVTWNLTSAITTNTRVVTDNWVSPSSLPGGLLFVGMGSNVCLSDSSMFLKSSSTKLEYLGNIGRDGSVTQFTNSVEVMHFPFTIGNSYTDNFSGKMISPTMGTINITGTINVVADGQGTLILPTNPTPTNFSVLRVKSNTKMLVTGTGTLSILTGTINSVDYQFFKTGSKFPLLNYSYSKINIPLLGLNQTGFDMTYDASLTINVPELSNNTPYLFVFPNPSQHQISIQTNQNNPNYKLQIFSINGQSIFKDKLNTETYNINIDQWSKGIYIIQITDETNNQTYSTKFIKE